MLRKYQTEYDSYVYSLKKWEKPVTYRRFAHRIIQKQYHNKIKAKKECVIENNKTVKTTNDYIEWLEKVISWHEDLNKDLINDKQTWTSKEDIEIIDDVWETISTLTSRQKKRIKNLTNSQLFTFFRRR